MFSDAEKIIIDRHKRDCGFYNESKILHTPRGLHVFYCHEASNKIIIHLLEQAKACRSSLEAGKTYLFLSNTKDEQVDVVFKSLSSSPQMSEM